VLAVLAIWNHPRVWLAFSIAFGIVGPLVCFGIVTADESIGLWLWPLNLFVLLAVITMTLWLALRRSRPWMNPLAPGVFTSGALFAAPLAVFFGYFGVVFLGGSLFWGDSETLLLVLLGVQPILTLVTNAVNASKARAAVEANEHSVVSACLAGVAALSVPFCAWLALNAAAAATENAVLESTRPLSELHLGRWQRLAPGYEWPQLRFAYSGELRDSSEVLGSPRTALKQRIADAYLELTGEPIHWSD